MSPPTPPLPPPTDDLVDLLVDVDPSVRLSTVMQLGETPRHDAAAAIVERFGRERDFQIREVLTWAALRMQDAAMPLVREALDSPLWLARLQATHTLSKPGLAEDAARLLPVIDDPVDCVAARAYWAAAQCGDPIAVPALVGQLGRGDAEHRNSLLVALNSFEDAVVELVQALVGGAAPRVREQAADILAYLGAPRAGAAEQALRLALDDESEDVRVAALNALGHLATTSARHVIEGQCSRPGRVGTLARRLTADEPGHRWQPTTPPQVTPDGGRRVGRRWPTPDLSLVTVTDSPLAARLRPMLSEQVRVCRPTWLTRAEVPGEVLDDVRQTALGDAIAAGRSAPRAARIAAGRVELFIHERVFHEQVCVVDPGRTIDELLYGTGVRITDFDRAPATRTP